MTSKLICFLIGVLGIVSIVIYWFKQPDEQAFVQPPAYKTIQFIPEGEKQVNVSMSRYEWRLLILQTNYEKKEYEKVIELAPKLMNDLKAEPKDRREVFAYMIEDSYRQLGQTEKVLEVRQQLAA